MIANHKINLSKVGVESRIGGKTKREVEDVYRFLQLKPGFPLPQIDQLVDSIAGHELFSFIDAYQVTTKSQSTRQMRNIRLSLRIKAYIATG